MPNLTKLTTAQKIEVLITQVNVMQEKIDHISDTVEKQSKDIADLNKRMNMGIGGVRAIAIFGGIIIGIITLFTSFFNLK
jgi:tetrahydromethanopterin S-methyltransferase subunit G